MEDRNIVRLIRNLQRRGERRRSEVVVCEGVRVVEEALRADLAFDGALVSELLERTPRGTKLRQDLERREVPIQSVDDNTLSELADTQTPQGVVAVVRRPEWSLDILEPTKGRPVLVLDSVRDPGNVGTIIRTAYALGAAGIILLRGSARANHPKVVRASAGAVFSLPVIEAQDTQFAEWVTKTDSAVWVAAAEGRAIPTPPEKLAIVVGNEGEGVRDDVRLPGHLTVAVGMVRDVDSLNVSVATAILLHEVQRDS